MIRLTAIAPAAVLSALVMLCGAAVMATPAGARSPAGLWRTFDDRTGKPAGLLLIYEQNGEFYARIHPGPGGDTGERCTACVDERRNQPMAGLVIMRRMRFADGMYRGGDILDPRSGSVYHCQFRLEPDGSRLVVRGYIGISLFGRSQTWLREG